MLHIFDLGNVIIDIDFNRVLGVWSNFSGVPLATIRERFSLGEAFELHERGEISDETFAQMMSDKMMLPLSFEQFSLGWQAIFVGVRQDTIDIMHKLRASGHKVVVLSNTNNLHCLHWPEKYPEVMATADKFYLSQEMGMRKPESRIYQAVLDSEGVLAHEAIFFDDNADNIAGAKALGINVVHVIDDKTIPAYFSSMN